MTDKPKTLALNARQWRVLLHDNLEVLKGAVAGTETINEGGLKQLVSQLDDMKMLAKAWFQVSVPVPSEVPAQGNGAEPIIPKRRGRPPKAAQTQVVQ